MELTVTVGGILSALGMLLLVAALALVCYLIVLVKQVKLLLDRVETLTDVKGWLGFFRRFKK